MTKAAEASVALSESSHGETASRAVLGKPMVVVLGMHRSGTSVATRLLRELGWFLGDPVALLGPREDNADGFYERADVQVLNDEILESLDASWDAPPSHEEVVGRVDQLEALRVGGVLADLAAEASGTPVALKDPRICLLWPLWERHFPADVLVLLAFRDPIEVARSLHARDGLPVQVGLALWEDYVLRSLQARAGRSALVLRYGDLVADPEAAVGRLADALAIELTGSPATAVRTELRRSRPEPGDDGLLTDRQRSLWEWVQALPERVDALDTDGLPTDLSPSSADLLRQRRSQVRLARSAEALERSLERRGREISDLTSEKGSLERLLRQRHDELEDVQKSLSAAVGKSEDVQKSLSAAVGKTERVAVARDSAMRGQQAAAIELSVLRARLRHLEGVWSRQEQEQLRQLRDLGAERDGLLHVVESQRQRRLDQAQRLAHLLQAGAAAEAREAELTRSLGQQSDQVHAERLRNQMLEFERDNLVRAVVTIETQRRGHEARLVAIEASRAWRLSRWFSLAYRKIVNVFRGGGQH
jgi:hypothetical protein